MKKVFFLIFAVVSLGLISCNDDKSDEFANSEISVQTKNSLVGNWSWVSTNGGIGNHINETPTSTGKEIMFKISNDFKYEILENNISKSIGTYSLTLKNSIYSTEKQVHIQLSEENSAVSGVVTSGIILFDESGKLNISDNFHDGIGSQFSK